MHVTLIISKICPAKKPSENVCNRGRKLVDHTGKQFITRVSTSFAKRVHTISYAEMLSLSNSVPSKCTLGTFRYIEMYPGFVFIQSL